MAKKKRKGRALSMPYSGYALRRDDDGTYLVDTRTPCNVWTRDADSALLFPLRAIAISFMIDNLHALPNVTVVPVNIDGGAEADSAKLNPGGRNA